MASHLGLRISRYRRLARFVIGTLAGACLLFVMRPLEFYLFGSAPLRILIAGSLIGGFLNAWPLRYMSDPAERHPPPVKR
jgi:hypothetical protein